MPAFRGAEPVATGQAKFLQLGVERRTGHGQLSAEINQADEVMCTAAPVQLCKCTAEDFGKQVRRLRKREPVAGRPSLRSYRRKATRLQGRSGRFLSDHVQIGEQT